MPCLGQDMLLAVGDLDADLHEQVFGPPVNNLESGRLDTGGLVLGASSEGLKDA